jgi:hypothetical protein
MAVSLRRITAVVAALALLGALPACSSKPPDDGLGEGRHRRPEVLESGR